MKSAPTSVPESRIAELGRERGVFKRPAAQIPIETGVLKIEVRDKNVRPAVAINVGGVSSHARFGLAVFADGDAGLESHFAEATVVIVTEKEIRVRVVSDEDVLPAVVVEVECNYAQTAAGVRPDPGSFGNIGEGSVAVVMVKDRTVVTEYHQIWVTVIVVISHGDAHPE